MQIDAMLCNHAEAVNNVLYISGGGASYGAVSSSSSPPYLVHLGIGIIMSVPWQSTNQQHDIDIALLTEDGIDVRLPNDQTLNFKATINVGRPPFITPGDDQHVCLAANFPGLPLPALGKYIFSIKVDGNEERRLTYRVLQHPGAPIQFSR